MVFPHRVRFVIYGRKDGDDANRIITNPWQIIFFREVNALVTPISGGGISSEAIFKGLIELTTADSKFIVYVPRREYAKLSDAFALYNPTNRTFVDIIEPSGNQFNPFFQPKTYAGQWLDLPRTFIQKITIFDSFVVFNLTFQISSI